jgi:hypothetical protein
VTTTSQSAARALPSSDLREVELLERCRLADLASAEAERCAIVAEVTAGAAERLAREAERRAEAAVRDMRDAHTVYEDHLSRRASSS